MSSIWSSSKHVSSANSIIPDLILEELKQRTNEFILLNNDDDINIITTFEEKTTKDIDFFYKESLENAILSYYSNNKGNTHSEGINFFIHQIKKPIIESLYNTIDNKLVVLIQIESIDEIFEQNKDNEDTSEIFQILLNSCVEKLDRYNTYFSNLVLFVFNYTNDSVKKHSTIINLMKTIRNTYFVDCIIRDIKQESIADFNTNIEKLFLNKYFDKTYISYNESLQNKQTNILSKSISKLWSFTSDSDSKKVQQKKLESEEEERNYESLSSAQKFEKFNKYKKLAVMNLLKRNANIRESNKSIEQCMKEIDDSVIFNRYTNMIKVSEYHKHMFILQQYNKMYDHSITISDLYTTLNEFELNYEFSTYLIPIIETVCHAGNYIEDFIRIYEFMLNKTPENSGNNIIRGFFIDRISSAYELKNQNRKWSFNTLLSLREWKEALQNDLMLDENKHVINTICEFKSSMINSFYNDVVFSNELNKYK